MSELSNFLEDELFDDVLRAAAYTGPATVYLAIFSAAPGEAGGGTEITDDGRQAIAFGAPTNGSGSNSGVITFDITSVTTATHAGLFDALTVGNLLMYTPLTASIGPTVSGDTIRFPIGNVIATFQ